MEQPYLTLLLLLTFGMGVFFTVIWYECYYKNDTLKCCAGCKDECDLEREACMMASAKKRGDTRD